MAATVKWIYPPNFNYDGAVAPPMRRVVIQVFDYDSGDAETDFKVLDLSELLTHNKVVPTRTAVDSIEYDASDCTVKLAWDRAPKDSIAVMSGQGKLDWSVMGGNVDRGEAGDGTGDILLSTVLTGASCSYSITISARIKE